MNPGLTLSSMRSAHSHCGTWSILWKEIGKFLVHFWLVLDSYIFRWHKLLFILFWFDSYIVLVSCHILIHSLIFIEVFTSYLTPCIIPTFLFGEILIIVAFFMFPLFSDSQWVPDVLIKSHSWIAIIPLIVVIPFPLFSHEIPNTPFVLIKFQRLGTIAIIQGSSQIFPFISWVFPWCPSVMFTSDPQEELEERDEVEVEGGAKCAGPRLGWFGSRSWLMCSFFFFFRERRETWQCLSKS